jgi:hypothetical protein
MPPRQEPGHAIPLQCTSALSAALCTRLQKYTLFAFAHDLCVLSAVLSGRVPFAA